MSDVRVHVDRARPTCPFCKDEVAGGLVWVCPGCAASHHAACHDEHRACASCALAEPREGGVTVATKGDTDTGPGGDDPSALAPRRRELERLGYEIVREAKDELVAVRMKRERRLARSAGTVFVRRLAHLTLAHLQADLAALAAHPLGSRITVPVYLVDRADADARRFVAEGAAVSRFRAAGRLFPVIHEGETGAGTYYTGTRLLGGLTFPRLRFLARRLLYPWLAPAAPPVWPAVFVLAVVALMLVMLGVLTAVGQLR